MRVGVILREQQSMASWPMQKKKFVLVACWCVDTLAAMDTPKPSTRNVLVAFHGHPSQRKREKQSSERPSHLMRYEVTSSQSKARLKQTETNVNQLSGWGGGCFAWGKRPCAFAKCLPHGAVIDTAMCALVCF
jgi:hypothetical protein